MNVRIDIDRLVLEGLRLTSRDASMIRPSVESELQRLIENEGIHRDLQSGGAIARVSAPSVGIPPEAPARFGEEIARSVYRGIGKR